MIKPYHRSFVVRNPVPKIVATNASVILPVVAQSNASTVSTEIPSAKTTQVSSMSGIQALAAIAAATQKITVSPSQIKVGKYTFICFHEICCF